MRSDKLDLSPFAQLSLWFVVRLTLYLTLIVNLGAAQERLDSPTTAIIDELRTVIFSNSEEDLEDVIDHIARQKESNAILRHAISSAEDANGSVAAAIALAHMGVRDDNVVQVLVGSLSRDCGLDRSYDPSRYDVLALARVGKFAGERLVESMNSVPKDLFIDVFLQMPESGSWLPSRLLIHEQRKAESGNLVLALEILGGLIRNGWEIGDRENLAVQLEEIRKSSGAEVLPAAERALAYLVLSTDVSNDSLIYLSKLSSFDGEVDLRNSTVDDKGLAFLGKAKKIKAVYLPPAIGDEGAAHLRGLVDLEKLDLEDGNLTPDGAQSLAMLPKLRVLSLRNCVLVDDSVVVAVAKSPNLTELDLHGTKVSDRAVAKLAKAPRINSLILPEGITDKSVVILASMKSLEVLDIWSTEITLEGAKALWAALPTCRVIVREDLDVLLSADSANN